MVHPLLKIQKSVSTNLTAESKFVIVTKSFDSVNNKWSSQGYSKRPMIHSCQTDFLKNEVS